MERSVATWNEQILSRRRGLSGRFMSLSKRWTPFGSSRNSASASPSSNSNYDSLQGFYRPDSPEAIMRRLADYCFMLRDWKLALSTYDILRTDFQNDKAWRHYAGASEMAALSSLMSPTPLSSKSRADNIESCIDAASYSYTDRQRSAAPYYALRTLAQRGPDEGGPVHGVLFRGRRYDTGDKLDYLRTVVKFAADREDLAPEFVPWLREFLNEIS